MDDLYGQFVSIMSSLTYDLGLLDASLTRAQAEEVIAFLTSEGLLDYDTLKEHYLYDED